MRGQSTDSHGDREVADRQPRAAVVYQILHHFREPIFSRLAAPRPRGPVYMLYASPVNDIDDNQTLDPSRAGRRPEDGGLPWKFIRNRPLGGPFLWQSGVLRVALSQRHDVIVFLGNMYFLSTWLGAAAARLTGKRVLFWGHGYTRPERNLKGWIRACFYRLAHGALLYGDRARRLMEQRGFARETLHVVYNSLDYARQSQVRTNQPKDAERRTRSALFAEPDLPQLVCIGRLDARKRLDRLIDAVVDLESRGNRVNLLLIGDGHARPELEERAARLGVSSRVHLYGACFEEEEIGPLLLSSDLCVCPGHVGLTAVHTMAYGLPVITHDDLDEQAPEVEAIVPGVTGDLYRHGDHDDMISRIDHWLRDHTDRRTASVACIDTVELRYTPEKQLEVIDRAVMGLPASDPEVGAAAAESSPRRA